MTSVRDALTIAAAVGGYFEVDLDPAAEPSAEWATLGELIADESSMREQVDAVRASLASARGLDPGAVDRRPAASVWFLGTVARLVSPLFGAVVLTDVVATCTLDSVRWRIVDEATAGTGNRLRVHLQDVGGRTGPPSVLGRTVHAEIIDTVVTPLVHACATTFQVSEKVLWGNVASSFNGANLVLDDARPATRTHGAELLRDIVEIGPLNKTGRFTRRGFVRNSCCLIYRIPKCGYCGDCVLLERPA